MLHVLLRKFLKVTALPLEKWRISRYYSSEVPPRCCGAERPYNLSMSTKPTTCKEAIRRWEEENEQEAAKATEVILSFQWPPIEKMDNALAALASCEKLSLSTNLLEKIAGVGSLKNLRILSLGRNLIKGFAGLEALGDTLEELWISYNCIEKTKGVQAMRNLRVLYMSNNLVREWNELMRLQELPNIRDLLFVGGAMEERGRAAFANFGEARRRAHNPDGGESSRDANVQSVARVARSGTRLTAHIFYESPNRIPVVETRSSRFFPAERTLRIISVRKEKKLDFIAVHGNG